MASETDYAEEATGDAWGVVETCVDDIVSSVESGLEPEDGDEVIDEGIRNCEMPGLSLRDAAELLHQLRDHEETDEGLWEGLRPADAVVAQASYTYQNAVRHEVRSILEDLCGHVDSMDDTLPESLYGTGQADEWKAVVARFYCEFGQTLELESNTADAQLLSGVLDELKQGQSAGLSAAIDFFTEKNMGGTVATLREILKRVPEADEPEEE